MKLKKVFSIMAIIIIFNIICSCAKECVYAQIVNEKQNQDAPAMAEACYLIGMNLVNNKKPLDGTSYSFDETGVAIRIPFKEYVG